MPTLVVGMLGTRNNFNMPTTSVGMAPDISAFSLAQAFTPVVRSRPDISFPISPFRGERVEQRSPLKGLEGKKMVGGLFPRRKRLG